MEHINTLYDVKTFFRHLYLDKKLIFHPDDKFDSYFNHNTGQQSFSSEECDRLDQLMDECFSVCEEAKVDIYELGTQTFYELAIV